MKHFLIVLIVLPFLSCANKKKSIEAKDESSTKTEQSEQKLIGKVLLNDNCPFFIETHENGETVRMYPVNLADQYKKQGCKIQFTYLPSRAMQPNQCEVDKVVVVENVELAK